MSEIRVYILPLNDNLTYQTDYVDVTKDVAENNIGTIKEQTDSGDFDVGLFKFNSTSLALNNYSGRYNEPDQPQSIFRGTRSNSRIKITWQIANDLTQCDNAICGNAFTNIETTIFEGLLADDSAGFSINSQLIKFRVLGLESLFDREIWPFAYIDEDTDYLSDVIYKCLNQTAITNILTVDALNINVGSDYILNHANSLIYKTVTECLSQLLFLSNSILYIKNNTIYVASRASTSDVKYSFYGHTSEIGMENIISIDEIKPGLSKTYNSVRYENELASIVEYSTNLESINDYGKRNLELNYDLINVVNTIRLIASDVLEEYATPKTELLLKTKLNYEILNLNFFDKVDIDYPVEFYTEEGIEMPLYSVAIYGIDRYPWGKWFYLLNQIKKFKIVNRDINLMDESVIFKLREV